MRKTFTRTTRGVKTRVYASRGVRRVATSTGFLQPRVTRAPAIKLVKFWESFTPLVAHYGTDTSLLSTTRNVKVLNLIDLGTNIYHRVGNRCWLKNMLMNVRVSAPPRLPGGVIPSVLGMGETYRGNPSYMGAMNTPFDYTDRGAKYYVGVILLYVPYPRGNPPNLGTFLAPDIGSHATGTEPGPFSWQSLSDIEGARILWKKVYTVSDEVSGTSALDSVRYQKGRNSIHEESVSVPLNFTTTFMPDIPGPMGYPFVTRGALVLYAISHMPSPTGPDQLPIGLPQVVIQTRTAYTDTD